MGLPMAHEEDFQPQSPSHVRNLASWLILQTARTQSNVSSTDTTHFAQCGAFPSRPVTQSTPVTLRLEIHDASTSHLPPGVHRTQLDIHALAAQTLPDPFAVLRRQIRNLPFSRIVLEMKDHDGIEASPPMELPAQSTHSTDDMYDLWWQAQFVYGRVGVVTVKVIDTT